MSKPNKRKGAESSSEPTAKKMRTAAESERKIAKKSKSVAPSTEPDLPATRRAPLRFFTSDDSDEDLPAYQKRRKAEKSEQRKIASPDPEPEQVAKPLTRDEGDAKKSLKKSGKNKPAQVTGEEKMEDDKNSKKPRNRLNDSFEGFGDAGEDPADATNEVGNTEAAAEADGAALLKGFDSDTPDDAEDVGLSLRDTPPIIDPDGKIEESLREARRKSGPDDEPGTIYVGRIPHGFFEVQMRAFYSQFGDIVRLRLSRNRHTGASKHFAFIEFASAEVAKIAAKTMDGYLMFGHILKSKFAPSESLHPDVWKGANKKFHKIPHKKLEGQKLASPKSVEQWESKKAKEESRRKKKAKALKEIGYDMPDNTLADAMAVAPKNKAKNLDDVAASRQLRLENGDSSKLEDSDNDPTTPAPAASSEANPKNAAVPKTKTKTKVSKDGVKKPKEKKAKKAKSAA